LLKRSGASTLTFLPIRWSRRLTFSSTRSPRTWRPAAGGRVELRGFGAFSTRQRDGRTGRNPKTGVTVDVPEKRVPYFKPGKGMKERLNLSDD
jgi:hypothetical protein